MTIYKKFLEDNGLKELDMRIRDCLEAVAIGVLAYIIIEALGIF